jgi:hypothetical protein
MLMHLHALLSYGILSTAGYLLAEIIRLVETNVCHMGTPHTPSSTLVLWDLVLR